MLKAIYTPLCALLIILSSCGSSKQVPYFQDLDYSRGGEERVSNYKALSIQAGDYLSVNVQSISPEAAATFGAPTSGESTAARSYIVNSEGIVDLPMVGQIKAAGKTTESLSQELKQKFSSYFRNPTVSVRIQNLRVTVLGDVQRPDVYPLTNEKTTITQALALAGDLNITARRDRVVLIREEGGDRRYIPIDLRSKKLLSSPYYYLKNNDEIYVQPGRSKAADASAGSRSVALVLSGLSFIAIIVTSLTR